MSDLVTNPPHYTEGRSFEPLDVLQRYFGREPLLWQVGKYLSRYNRKGDGQLDLQKAMYYLNRRIETHLPVDCYQSTAVNDIDRIVEDWFPRTLEQPHLVIATLAEILHAACCGDQRVAKDRLNTARRHLSNAITKGENRAVR